MARGINRRRFAGAAWRLFAGCALALLLCIGLPSRPQAAGTTDATPASVEPAAKIRQLLDLLADPDVQSWIQANQGATQAQPVPAPGNEATPAGFLARRFSAIREHFDALAAVLPVLPVEFSRAGEILMQEFGGRPILGLLAMVLGFLALGFGTEWLFGRVFRGIRERLYRRPAETGGQRLAAASIRLAFETAGLLAFVLGSAGLFAVMAWPPLLEQIALGYLTAFLALRLALILGRFLLAPRPVGAAGMRLPVLPMGAPAARFWYRRQAWLIGWFFFGWITVGLLAHLGFDGMGRLLVAYVLGLGLLAMGLEAVWRQPRPPRLANQPPTHDLVYWLVSGYFIVLFLLWVAWALQLFWLSVVVVTVPAAVHLTRRVVDHWLQSAVGGESQAPAPSILAVCLQRGLQDALIIGGALVLAHFWRFDLIALTMSDSMTTRILRGAFSVVIIGLLADFAWQLIKAAIDRKIAEPPKSSDANSEAWRRQARLRTLLPILRNLLFILLLVMVIMLALATMGVDIAPLIAGAGIVGVAIGFGAQTLVKDIISGMFYLLDDAFRVGEYIQSGDFKGTVESFSLRSIKLRHHRGPLFTIPFGELGAVENMSRDWVIEKLEVGVAYDTDLGKVKKLIKQIGEALQQDSELGPKILEPLKMQGVEEFGDFAIQIRMKMMTKPGEQFAVRRRAYAMIKDAFDANGINMPLPTVQVTGGDSAAGAAAQHELSVLQQQSGGG